MTRVSAWFAALTRREQVLVATGGVLAALVVLVYGIILPTGTALDEAALRHRSSLERSGRLAQAMDMLKSAPAAVPGQASAGPVDQQVAASAADAGFVLQSNQPRGNDVTVIAIPNARPVTALGWLDGLADHGLAVEQVTMTPSPEGTVSISATLRRSAS